MNDESKIRNPKSAICLTIAGLDPSGGAGVIADIKTFASFGCFATAAVASLTFQNTIGVFGAIHQTAETVRGQVQPILDDYEISALKTGMLPTGEVIEEVARIVGENELKNFVVDPVVRSTSGYDLIDDAALETLIEKLSPLAAVVTPNVPEAERIARIKIETEADVRRAAEIMRGFGARAVVVKGGHFPNAGFGRRKAEGEEFQGERFKLNGSKTDRRQATDFLFVDGREIRFSADFIETDATHGTGCTFAAAITANLALGKNLVEAIETAKRFVTEAIRTAPRIGRGHSPVNHSLSGFGF